MSTISRAIQNATRRSTVSMTPKRAFHSPFAILSAGSSRTTTNASSSAYEKNTDIYGAEPTFSYNGRKTYVVCEPDPQSTHYKVPAGAYPTSEPYVNYDHEATTPSEPGVASSGPAPPLGRAATKYSRMGNAEAWKIRA